MQKIPLYRYTRPDGGVTTSPVKPDVDYTELYRLVADENMTLTNGEVIASCTDTDNPDAWTEIVDIESDETENSELSETVLKAHAYDIITGVSE